MLQDWLQQLEEQSAVIENDIAGHFGNEPAENSAADAGDVLADLSYCGLVRISGEDAKNFLQGQFSNDINAVDETHSQLSSYCTAKGRMLASFRLFSDGTDYYMRLPRDLIENTCNRLRMYVLMSKVEVEILPAIIGIGLSGANTRQLLQQQLDAVPAEVDAVSHPAKMHILQVPGGQERFEIWGDINDIKPLWQSLSTATTPAGSNTWRYLDIQAGIPMIFPQTVEAFVPQMANMDVIHAVNFKKGCYPGQEIVARMHYLGTLKRRMYRCRINGSAVPAPGEALVTSDAEGNQAAGQIVDARPHSDDSCMALAVLQIKLANTAGIQVKNSPTQQLTLLDLPYSLEISEQE
jgi:folate-binding protein YgfZ